MEEQNQGLIDQFNKSSIEIVKIHLSKWKSQDYIDIRIWITSNLPEQDEDQPTKKGIRISADLLPRLIESLEKAQQVLNEGAEKRAESSVDAKTHRC